MPTKRKIEIMNLSEPLLVFALTTLLQKVNSQYFKQALNENVHPRHLNRHYNALIQNVNQQLKNGYINKKTSKLKKQKLKSALNLYTEKYNTQMNNWAAKALAIVQNENSNPVTKKCKKNADEAGPSCPRRPPTSRKGKEKVNEISEMMNQCKLTNKQLNELNFNMFAKYLKINKNK